jgi:uncharacterized protein
MLWLIDGYNLMHAAGAVASKGAGGAAFQRKRRQFLNHLAHALGGERARETTVVFDANSPPADFDLETTYKGLNLIFALGDESADARIEQLIAAHTAPRSLTVVSTDRRVRRAATRRKARSVTADAFLDELDRLGRKRAREAPAETPSSSRPPDRDAPLSADETAYWLSEFAELDLGPEIQRALAPDQALLTDEEIAQIQREIDRET